ncbi:MAG: serine/threonine protein kinase [Magnetococcales bacterium]|nr:serine/threonine protein kinase [Magnetococcales bacterium]
MSHPQNIDRFTVESVISQGSNNTIYKAYDPKLKRAVSIKTISPKKFNSPDKKKLKAKIIWEFKTTIDLNHPNIVTYFELINIDSTVVHTSLAQPNYSPDKSKKNIIKNKVTSIFSDSQDKPTYSTINTKHAAQPRLKDTKIPFIVMEYMATRTLKSWLVDKHQFSINEGVEIIGQLLSALEHIHNSGITHRDIKPGNIFLFADGKIKICDFGISHPTGKTQTQIDFVQGTPAYMAPEQLISSQATQHADIFSTGVILYELLCGKKPFSGVEQKSIIQQILTKQPAKVSSVNTNVPKYFDKIIQKALAKRPGDRFQSAKEFKNSLDKALV